MCLNSTVGGDQGKPITFVVFPKSLAVTAWLVDTKQGRRLLFSDATILNSSDGFMRYSVGNNVFNWTVYPALAEAPRRDNAAISTTSAPHSSMSAYSLTLPGGGTVRACKGYRSSNSTLSTDGPALPENVNDVFLDIDYQGDVGMAFINGSLVDDEFYFGQPWRIGLKRFLPRVAEDGMYISFRPMSKDAPFLADLPPDRGSRSSPISKKYCGSTASKSCPSTRRRSASRSLQHQQIRLVRFCGNCSFLSNS